MKMDFKNTDHIFNINQKILENNAEFPYLTFDSYDRNFSDWIAHCFTTRQGGVSNGIYESLNLSFHRGDEREAVFENFRRVAEALGTTPEHIVFSDQTHTTNVRRVTKEDCGGEIMRPLAYSDVDGLITNEPGVLLSTFYADCVPLYFVDPKHRAIGLSHSGWRGTVVHMGRHTLEEMNKAFGTEAADVYCAIGPSICMDCYEISDDVAEEFIAAYPGHEDEILLNKHNGHYQLDLWKANQCQLLEAGIAPEHLSVTNLCTCENPSVLFSHRASKGKRGNLGAFLMIKEEA